jgi:hypothetical protein
VADRGVRRDARLVRAGAAGAGGERRARVGEAGPDDDDHRATLDVGATVNVAADWADDGTHHDDRRTDLDPLDRLDADEQHSRTRRVDDHHNEADDDNDPR